MKLARERTVATLATTATICLSMCLVATAADPNNSWHQWRGPERDGTVRGASWPDSLGKENLQKVWRLDLGPSYSGPIVNETHVFVTETEGRKFEVVRALDRKTGKVAWEAKWEGSMRVPFFAMANGSWIRSTPALDNDHLYVGGMRDVLVCLNAKDGSEVWKVDFVKSLKSPVPSFGFVSSPMVDGEFVYVQAGGGLCKLNKKTGELVWQGLKDGGGMYGSAFSSPILATIQGRKQIVVQSRKFLAGLDPQDGEVLWKEEIQAFRGMNILTPTIIGDKVFTSAYGGKSLLFEIAKEGEKWSVNELWRNKSQGYMSSPVVANGHIYLHLRNQRFTCIDIESGESKWTSKPYGKYWSLLRNDDKLLALDERGELLLIQASPEDFELSAQLKVSEQSTWAHLAVLGEEVFVRDLKGLTVYRWD